MYSKYYRVEDYRDKPESLEKVLFDHFPYLVGGEEFWTKSLEAGAGADYEAIPISEMSNSHLKNALKYISKDYNRFKRVGAGKYTEEVESVFKNKIIELELELKNRK